MKTSQQILIGFLLRKLSVKNAFNLTNVDVYKTNPTQYLPKT